MHARAARGAAVRTHRRRAASPARRTAAWIFAPAACAARKQANVAEAGIEMLGTDRGAPRKKESIRRTGNCWRAGCSYSRVAGRWSCPRQRNDRVIADLMACGLDGGEILEHATIELDTVIVPEIADGVVADSAREVREYRGLIVCGVRAATWNLSREGMLPANGR
jgi:hypothetical protein